jgi:hypothetical protein
MKVIRNRRLAEQVKQFRARFAQSAGSCLAQTIPAASLQAWVKPPCGHWRERLYGPLPTLKLFLDQVLSADLSCQDAVCRALSERVAQGAAPCSLNSASYCAARRRLPLARVARVAQEIGLRLQAQQPASWPWRGRSVIRVVGTTVSTAARCGVGRWAHVKANRPASWRCYTH